MPLPISNKIRGLVKGHRCFKYRRRKTFDRQQSILQEICVRINRSWSIPSIFKCQKRRYTHALDAKINYCIFIATDEHIMNYSIAYVVGCYARNDVIYCYTVFAEDIMNYSIILLNDNIGFFSRTKSARLLGLKIIFENDFAASCSTRKSEAKCGFIICIVHEMTS